MACMWDDSIVSKTEDLRTISGGSNSGNRVPGYPFTRIFSVLSYPGSINVVNLKEDFVVNLKEDFTTRKGALQKPGAVPG